VTHAAPADHPAALPSGAETPETEPSPLTVLVYGDDAAIRQRVMLALGPRPAKELPRVEYVEVATEPVVHRTIAAGGIDLAILDGEAWPAGGMGICRQLKDEIYDPPPVLVLIGRRDDAWLASWSLADGVVTHPIDPPTLVDAAVALLRARDARLPAH
jgi:DNA-binding response OmpR family regulator